MLYQVLKHEAQLSFSGLDTTRIANLRRHQNHEINKQYEQVTLSLYTFWETSFMSFNLVVFAESYALSAIPLPGGSYHLLFELNHFRCSFSLQL